MGNRTSKTDSGGTGTGATYTFDAANRLTSVTPTGGSSATVTFDANGNTLSDASGRTYTWDSENRMTSCTYNGDTTNYVYDGTNLVAEMKANASGTLVIVTSYLLGAQGIEAKIDETTQTEAYYELNPTTGARLFDANNNLIVAYRGVTSWYIYDGHGNVVGTVNGVTGAFTANPTLDVYGIPRASGTSATKQGYCGSLGHVTDDTGLVYMKARYYDPNVGRFVSQDPSGNGANWFIYANDNPITNVDKDGMSATNIGKLLTIIGTILIIMAAIIGFLAVPEVGVVALDIVADRMAVGVIQDIAFNALHFLANNTVLTALSVTLMSVIGAAMMAIAYFCDADSDPSDGSPSNDPGGASNGDTVFC